LTAIKNPYRNRHAGDDFIVLNKQHCDKLPQCDSLTLSAQRPSHHFIVRPWTVRAGSPRSERRTGSANPVRGFEGVTSGRRSLIGCGARQHGARRDPSRPARHR